jgi:formylglycine-generating enzyme required for sulfatase activity
MAAASLALSPGAEIGDLRVDRVLGHGAFSVTYLATDTVLNKSFALKEYLPGNLVERLETGAVRPKDEASERLYAAGRERFIEEGRTVAQLEHPNIVPVLRCFEANDTAYLLMPWYRGEALDALLRRSGTLTAEEAGALAAPLLDALEYVNERGVVHQDIKPANIYITSEGEPLLLDFGAAWQGPGGDAPAAARLGSEGYAAPEQSERGAAIGPWTDVYGLAATLYRCVSGRIPTAASQRREATAQGQQDPLHPIDELLPDSSFADIRRAIARGLVLEPGSRPQSVGEWRACFGAGQSGSGGVGQPPPPGVEREGREWLPMILLSLFFVALLAAILYLFTGDGGAPEDGLAGADAGARKEEPRPHASPAESARWKAALEADTAFGYRMFMEDFPDSVHGDQARLNLERLDHQAWGQAEQLGTKADIESYLEQFPGGLHEAEARMRLHEFELEEAAAERKRQAEEQRDHQAWEDARTSRTLAAVDGYLEQWPAGLHAEEARALRRQISDQLNDSRAFEAARALNTIEAYRSYIDAFPRGAHVTEALEAIDNLTLRPGKTFRDCAQCPTMMVVPAGSFWQGSDEGDPLVLKKETPRRMVNISRPFAVGIFEITMEQWDHCVEDGGCATRPTDNGWGRGSRPVIMVSWNDAQEYTSWLSGKTGQSYSLPSESQWEYVARAGEESDWLGGRPGAVCEYGNIAGSESGFRWQHEDCADVAAIQTLPVGSFRPNAFGLYDVIGNVAEWTQDCMNLSYLDAPADGSPWGRGICSSRMTRGGSWFTGTREIRLPARFNLKNGDRNDFTGFRVVRRVEDQP